MAMNIGGRLIAGSHNRNKFVLINADEIGKVCWFPCLSMWLLHSRNVHVSFLSTHQCRKNTEVEKYLSGKILSVAVLSEAVNLVKEAVIPEFGTSYPAYRKSLAIGFLFQFLFPFINLGSVTSGSLPRGLAYWLPEEASKNHSESYFGQAANSTLLSSSKQEVESSREYYPVGEPMPKFGSAFQASGFIFSFQVLIILQDACFSL